MRGERHDLVEVLVPPADVAELPAIAAAVPTFVDEDWGPVPSGWD
jgi:hypothetical protein